MAVRRSPAITEPHWGAIQAAKIATSRGNVFVSRVSLNECVQCGGDIIAPEWSEHLSTYCVRNVWSCAACGYRFEDTVYMSAPDSVNAD